LHCGSCIHLIATMYWWERRIRERRIIYCWPI